MLDYLVLYSSATGNTKKLATEAFSALPGTSKDIIDLKEASQIKEAKNYLVGFWINRGTCSVEVIDSLSTIHGKNVLLFGTCGMGSDPEYFETIQKNITVFVPEDNNYLGCFLCQGKMPIQVRQKYEQRIETVGHNPQIDMMIRNFDEALLHPNQDDLNNFKVFLTSHLNLNDSTHIFD